jgi:CTP synthase (UTP-ammonia lyase)
VAGIADAQHTEYGPSPGTALITPVACPLPDRPEGAPALSGTLTINLVPDSLLARILGRPAVTEVYTCNYELNPDFRARLVAAGLRVGAVDALGAVRAIELPDHPFYLATLFQPQRSSRAGQPHPLITAYLRAARGATIPTPPRH